MSPHLIPVTILGKVTIPLTDAILAAYATGSITSIAHAIDCPTPGCRVESGLRCVTKRGYARQTPHELRWSRAHRVLSWLNAHPEVTR